MNKEKMLYHAKHNGSLNFQSKDYRGHIADNLNFLIDGGFLKWTTNDLWKDYKSCGEEDLYETAFHEYKITPEGEVLLSIYRLEYADKNHRGTDKHISRVNEFRMLLEESGKKLDFFLPALTKNQRSASKLAVESQVVSTEPVIASETFKDEDFDISEMSLTSMFNMSTLLGPKDSNAKRTNDYVFKKCMEELGEMSLEDQIEKGLSYKEAGSDGVKGEAVDLAITAMDMFALQCPGMNSEEIEREFLAYMVKKLNKWKSTIL